MAFNKVTIKHVQELIILTAKKEEVTIESLDGLFTAADAHFKSRSDEENTLWAQIEDTKNQKRWQDLLYILDAGINVISAVNFNTLKV